MKQTSIFQNKWRWGVVSVSLCSVGYFTLAGVAQNTAPPAFGVPAAPPAAGATTGASTTPATETARPCLLPPQGLISWLPGEDKAEDFFPANKATADENLTFAPGKVGQSFNLRGSGIKLPASPRLDVGTGAGFTWEAWINPTDVQPRHPIFDFNNGETFGVHLWLFSAQGTPGTLFANFMDTSGMAHNVTTQPDAVKAGEWQHVALTYDKKTGVGTIYVNGLPAGQATVGQFRPQTTYDLVMGYRPGGLGKGMRFSGLMDEISLYNRPLNANEIRAIFQAGGAGKCNPQNAPAPAAPPVASKPTATPVPTPTVKPTPAPTPTMIPAAKVRQPLGIFTFSAAQGVNATAATALTDALSANLSKAGIQLKPRQHMDRVFDTLLKEHEKQLADLTAAGKTAEALPPALRDALLRRRAAQQMGAKSVMWGEIESFGVVKGQPPRIKFVIHLVDASSGTVIPDVSISESVADVNSATSSEALTEQMVAKAVSSTIARVLPLIEK